MRDLLEVSRELAAARDEEELSAALARGLERLFPGRSFCIRLTDPKTLALTSLYSRGRLRPSARERIAIRRSAVRKTGLSETALEAGGLGIVDSDEPVFEGCDRVNAVPLVASGALYGLVNVEYEAGSQASPEEDEPILLQVANQAAVAIRIVRSVEEVTYLKGFLEDLIENANALIVVVNREREVIVWNRALARLTGLARADALGEELAELVVDTDRERLAKLLDRTFEGETATGVELRLALEGTEARIVANSSAIYGASGDVEGVMLIAQDQTLLRALQDRAEQAQRLAETGRLAAAVVHELNNPLTAVTAYAESMVGKFSRDPKADPADLEKLKRILEAGQRIQRFSRDLIAYARPPQDQLELVNVRRILEQAASMCEPALRSARAQVVLQLEDVPLVWGVPGSLLQVFVNLITNAAHALEPSGGTVTLGLAPSGDHIAARVKDDGPGIPPAVKRRIFEPFFSTKPAGKGTGLGLSIVQGIVSRHGGAVTVESEMGQGASFTVMLPVRNPA